MLIKRSLQLYRLIFNMLFTTVLLGMAFTYSGCAKNPDQAATTIDGLWIGQGTFYSNCDNSPCKWRGWYGLDLVQNGTQVTGQMDFSMKAIQTLVAGATCEDKLIVADANITGTIEGGDTFKFTDPAGNNWSMFFGATKMEGQMSGSVSCDAQVDNQFKSNNLNVWLNSVTGVTGTSTTLSRRMVDKCDDQQNVRYRFFDVDNNGIVLQVWPATGYYQTDELNKTYINNLDCIVDHKICIGATRDDGTAQSRTLGADLEIATCIDCCQFCRNTQIFDDQLDCSYQ